MKSPYQYLFRFCCDPGFNDKEEISSLMQYADDALIDDVAVFANVEEINTGHMSFEEQEAYLSLMREVQRIMRPKGITMSINQWHSVMHADYGKHLSAQQKFRLMVDIEGNTSQLCVCPLCGEWQSYIAKLYARYAKLEPNILWVEDDFRLHNHAPLVWGGCFCDEHMRIYSKRVGKELTRQEFLQGVLQQGEPHPYRKIWLDVACETMLSAAEAIGSAVREQSDTVKVGLMSSVPHIHAAEGRDWHGIINTLAKGRAGVNRIHLPGYCEVTPSLYIKNFNMVSHMTRAMLPQNCEVYPELENFPYSRYAKSKQFTRFQLLSSLTLGIDGITIDLYDLNGSGIVQSEGYEQMLRQTKPFLMQMNKSGVFHAQRCGVKAMYSPRSAYTLHTDARAGMESLYPHETFFAGLLSCLGVPFSYCDNTALAGEVVAVSGQYLRNLTVDEITALFANNFILLNGDGAWTLFELGLGKLAGIRNAQWQKQDSGAFTFEQVVNGKRYCNLTAARSSAIVVCSDVLFCDYDSGAEEYTAMMDSYRCRRAPGQVVYQNKVFIYPFGNFEQPMDVPVMLCNTMRAQILHDVLKSANAPVPMVENVPYLVPYCYQKNGVPYMYLVNASTDDVQSAQISGMPEDIAIWRSQGEGWQVLPKNQHGYEINIAAMETALIAPLTEVLP